MSERREALIAVWGDVLTTGGVSFAALRRVMASPPDEGAWTAALRAVTASRPDLATVARWGVVLARFDRG